MRNKFKCFLLQTNYCVDGNCPKEGVGLVSTKSMTSVISSEASTTRPPAIKYGAVKWIYIKKQQCEIADVWSKILETNNNIL